MDGQILGEIPRFRSSAVPQRERCALCCYAQGMLTISNTELNEHILA